MAAVSRDGSLIALESSTRTVSILDRALNTLQIIPADGGVTFDPTQDVLYAADSATSQIVAYDTHTWAAKYRLDIGENITSTTADPSRIYGNGMMTVSADGHYLFLATLN